MQEENTHALMLGTDILDGKLFLSEHADRTYEHFIQIVPVVYKSRHGLTVSTYKYSVTSSEHEDSDSFPSAKFKFEISPMAIIMREEATPVYQFLTNMCAILGGLFTVFSMVAAVSAPPPMPPPPPPPPPESCSTSCRCGCGAAAERCVVCPARLSQLSDKAIDTFKASMGKAD